MRQNMTNKEVHLCGGGRRWLFVVLLSLCTFTLWAQTEEAVISQDLDLRSDAKNAFYTFNYPSVDAEGNPIVLSSALIAWHPSPVGQTDSIETVIAACHVTITSNYECPSEYPNTGSVGTDVGILQTIPVMGLTYERLRHSVIIMPDYEGYGVTKDRPHPYLSQEVTARQVADAVTFGLLLYQKSVLEGKNAPLKNEWKTFCMGYSQGGSVALATHRYIEQHSNLLTGLHFSGSICGDGPYDLLSTVKYYIHDNGTSHGASTAHRQNMLSMPVVMPLIMKGMLDAHPDMRNHQLSDYFSKKFLDTGVIGWIEDKAKPKDEQKTTNDISKLFYDLCEKGLTAADGTKYTAKEMQELFPTHSRSLTISGFNYQVFGDMRTILLPKVYSYLADTERMATIPEEKGDAIKDLHRALASNSTAEGWTPKRRIVFMHSKYDTIVPYDNYESFMNHHPDADYTRFEAISTKDHLDTAASFFAGLLTSGYKSHFEWLAEPLDEATDVQYIRVVDMDTDQTLTYDLSGRVINSPSYHGLCIQHGRKVLVK